MVNFYLLNSFFCLCVLFKFQIGSLKSAFWKFRIQFFNWFAFLSVWISLALLYIDLAFTIYINANKRLLINIWGIYQHSRVNKYLSPFVVIVLYILFLVSVLYNCFEIACIVRNLRLKSTDLVFIMFYTKYLHITLVYFYSYHTFLSIKLATNTDEILILVIKYNIL